MLPLHDYFGILNVAFLSYDQHESDWCGLWCASRSSGPIGQAWVQLMNKFILPHTEGRPDNTGAEVARELLSVGIPVTLILDSGVAYMMEKVDMVLVGAEGVVESGGIINMLGTYQAALVARTMNKPVYVAAESYKVFLQSQPLVLLLKKLLYFDGKGWCSTFLSPNYTYYVITMCQDECTSIYMPLF